MRRRRKGGLIQKRGLTNKLQEFRVISIDRATEGITMHGAYESFDDALAVAKECKQVHPTYDLYIHGDSNRVIAEV